MTKDIERAITALKEELKKLETRIISLETKNVTKVESKEKPKKLKAVIPSVPLDED